MIFPWISSGLKKNKIDDFSSVCNKILLRTKHIHEKSKQISKLKSFFRMVNQICVVFNVNDKTGSFTSGIITLSLLDIAIVLKLRN